MPTTPTAPTPTRTTSPVDVIVIGGGLAGLSAAQHLSAGGASVVVLEARDRVGGRVRSQRLDTGLTIDLGAQLLGDVQPRVSALVAEIGLTRVPTHSAGDVLYVPAPGAPAKRTSADSRGLSFLHQLDLLQAARRSEGAMRHPGREDVARLDSLTAAEYLRGITLLDESHDVIAAALEEGLCVPLDTVSAYELLAQLASAGGLESQEASEEWFLAEGTQPIAQHLAAELGARVVRHSPVRTVERDGDGVRVTATSGVYRARDVVVAVPPQLYADIGVPALLPQHRRQAVAGWVRADVVKTVLVFDRPFWRDRGLSGVVQSPGGLANAVIDGSPADGSAGVLVLFATSRSGRLFGRTAAEADRVGQAVSWLGELLGGPVPWPSAARSVDWSADRWSRGGYASHRGIGGWVLAPDLFAPCGPLHFAGTETATEWRGFMEGALQSGERAAAEITTER